METEDLKKLKAERKKHITLLIVAALILCLALSVLVILLLKPQEKECQHQQYLNGVCVECGEACQHKWVDGVCTICGEKCRHEEYKDGICTKCGHQCTHPSYLYGECATCGMKCEHEWHDGVCSKCLEKCQHEQHDSETQECVICGEKVVHHYKNGVCSCGRRYELWSAFEDDTILNQAMHQGTVEEVRYETPCWDKTHDGNFPKWMSIYTPYDYNPSKKYNVIFLYHGGGGDHTDWTTKEFELYDHVVKMKNVYDSMIERKMCEPFIAVSLSTGYFDDGYKFHDNSDFQNAMELKNVILPHIVQLYSTYAESSNVVDLRNAREHFAIGGDSNGSLFAYLSGMFWNFDIIGNYLFISGDNASKVVDKINSEEWEAYPITCLFCSGGVFDDQNRRVQRGYNLLLESTPRLKDGENAWYLQTAFGHEWYTFSIAFYNAIQVLFPQ